MFFAVHQHAKMVHLREKHWTEDELRELEAISPFCCPICEDRLILKLGDKQAWHFAHISNSSCSLNRGGESKEHLDGKLELAHWLEIHGYSPTLEKYFPHIKQRADVFVNIRNQPIAFELQRSAIPIKELINRTNEYEIYNIKPIWVGFQSESIQKHSIVFPRNTLHHHFIQAHPQLYSLYLDPKKKRWIVLSRFRYINSKKMMAYPIELTYSISPLNLFTLSLSTGNTVTSPHKYDISYLESWKKEIMKKRTKRYLSLSKAEAFVLPLFLQHQLNLNYVPALCCLPLKSNFLFTTAPELWQSHLVLNVINRTPINSQLTISNIINNYVEICEDGPFLMAEIGVHIKDMLRKTITEYFDVLCHFHVLKKCYIGVYMIKKHITVNKSLDTLIHDDAFVQKKMEMIFHETNEIYFEYKNIF
ncbi:hypothetical protein LGQ02_13955 [Bacillus shivajii]|uniref:competence protein CoiA n=1 Tax=Bacillus shivajii TaxID=1983719 RepID=UPI001CF9F3F9|nr:competence protein CoiA family protein [Bacillus shivajii]UCZ51951.1 hypothetical protein LGQ02_13955 [Bacillus shivajii]